MPRRVRLGLLAAVAALVAAALPLVGARAAETVRESGYVTVRDGTQLHYTYVRPADDAKVPTLLTYDGYDAGFDPDPGYIERYVPKGYAFIGVSLRGSGCSGGTWNFFQPAEATDGYDVIEWIAQQPWSDGKVAMIGKSYPGITQLFVAQTQPPHLVAIAPGHTYGDIYRDIAYPGGILNYGFSSLWSFIAQPYPSYSAALNRVAAGDPVCAQHLAQRPESVRYNPFLQAQEHQWDDDLIRERSPVYGIDKVNVPTWMVLAWQDEQVGPKSADMLAKIKAPTYAIVTNGDHGMYRTGPALAELDAFLDHYVKGVDNGFERRAPIKVWWEAGRDGKRAPGWITELDAWPATKRTRKLYLAGDGALSAKKPVTAGADSYAYAGPTGQGIENPRWGHGSLPDHQFYGERPDGPSVAYTTTPLERDLATLEPRAPTCGSPPRLPTPTSRSPSPRSAPTVSSSSCSKGGSERHTAPSIRCGPPSCSRSTPTSRPK
jgi:uncharacterized protein